MENGIQSKFGTMTAVIGQSATFGGFVFVPVLFHFDIEPCVPADRRTVSNLSYPLARYLAEPLPHALSACRDWQGELADAVWVRARLPSIFAFAPVPLTQIDLKYSLIEQPFVACRPSDTSDAWESVPFVCISHDFSTGLAFSPDGPSPTERAKIAKAFWGLFLLRPEEVVSFVDGFLRYRVDELTFAEWCRVEFGSRGMEVDYTPCNEFSDYVWDDFFGPF